MQNKTLAQIFSLVVGVTLVLVGVLGFIIEPSFAVGDSATSGTLILFDVNGWHNVVHLLTGAIGIAMAGSAASGRLFSLGFGVIYLLVTVLGFIVGDGYLLSIVAINTADNFLHLVLAGAAIAIGLTSPVAESGRPVTA